MRHRVPESAIRLPLFAAVILCVVLFSPTYAPGQEERACDEDIEAFCQDFQVYGGWTAKCLEQHMRDLTPACRVRMSGMAGQAQTQVGQACEDDIRYFCFGVKPGGGRIAGCLKANGNRLSAVCRNKLYEARLGVD